MSLGNIDWDDNLHYEDAGYWMKIWLERMKIRRPCCVIT